MRTYIVGRSVLEAGLWWHEHGDGSPIMHLGSPSSAEGRVFREGDRLVLTPTWRENRRAADIARVIEANERKVGVRLERWVERREQRPLYPRTPAEMVRQFHEVFGAPIAPEGYQGLGDEQLRRLRAELIREEFVELLGALGMAFWDEDEGVWADPEVRRFPNAPLDRVEVADALGDLVYVIYGAALSFGIDLDAVVAEIHRSNMTKLGADGKPIYREGDMKVLKGPAYERPNIRRVLGMEES